MRSYFCLLLVRFLLLLIFCNFGDRLRLYIGHSILDRREPELVTLHTSLQWYKTIPFCSSVILEWSFLEVLCIGALCLT